MKNHKSNCQCISCKSHRGEIFGNNSGRYIDGRTLKKYYCKDCEKEISDYRVKRCRKCADRHHSIEMNGKNNPCWKGGLPKCIDCGKTVTHKEYKRCIQCYVRSIKKYPYLKGVKKSKNWRMKISKTMIKNGTTKNKNNPMFGKVVHPKYIKYKNIYFHSSWEVAYAKYLDKRNIKWLYEFKTFDLGNTTYTPDFYIPKLDLYIEIKGFWRDDAIKKFKLFKKRYNNIKIEVLNEKKLKFLKII